MRAVLVVSFIALFAIALTSTSLYGLVGNFGGNILYLVNIDPSTGHYQLINDLSSFGGSLSIMKVDWKNKNLYFVTLGMKTLLYSFYVTDLTGNHVTNITTKTIINSLDWDQSLNTFYSGSVDPVKQEYDIMQWNLKTKTPTPMFYFNDNTQFEGVGTTFYIQHNHTLVQYTGNMASSAFSLTFIDTQKWTSQVVRIPDMIFAWAFDEPSNTLYYGCIAKNNDVQIKSYVLGSSGPSEIIQLAVGYGPGGGAASFDSTAKVFYVSLTDQSQDGFIATVDVVKKKAILVPTLFIAYCFEILPSSLHKLLTNHSVA